MNILITGGLGFIGFHISNFLIKLGHKIVILDKGQNSKIQYHRKEKLLTSNIHIGELQNEQLLSTILNDEHIDTIIHLAGKSGVSQSSNMSDYTNDNIVATSKLISGLTSNIKRVLYASSSSVVGGMNITNSTIELPVTHCPLSYYGVTKMTNEMMFEQYSKNSDIKFIGMRFHTVYGSYGRPDMAYFRFADSIKNNEPISLYGDQYRDFTHIQDVVMSIASLLDCEIDKHEIVNISNNAPDKVITLIDNLFELMNKRTNIIYKDARNCDPSITWGNNDKLFQLTGFRPNIKLKDGLTEFISWYNENKV